MTILQVKLDLPDQLAQEAKAAGLLSPDAIEAMLRETLRRRAIDELFAAMDRMAAVEELAMTPEEIAEELHALRAERRSPR